MKISPKYSNALQLSEKNRTVIFGLIAGSYLIFGAFNPPIYPQIFIGILCVLFGVNYVFSATTFTYNASNSRYGIAPSGLKWLAILSSPNKYIKLYRGLWIRFAGFLLAILGVWLILAKPAFPWISDRQSTSDIKPILVNKPEDYLQQTEMFQEALAQNLDKSPTEGYSYQFSQSGENNGCRLVIEKKDAKYAVFSIMCDNDGGNRYLALNMQQGWTVITGLS